MLIKEISEETGASIRSIRYYEEKGLLNPNRLDNGYREYTNQDVSIINSIQVYLQLGFKIDEISEDCTLKDPLLDSNRFCCKVEFIV